MRTFGYAFASVIVALAFATAAHAQPPQTPPGQAQKINAPQQTQDRGESDAGRDLTPVEQAAVLQQYGKNESGVTFSTLSNGAVVAQVDDSYAEALTVTRRPDGTLVFGHTTGLQNAARAVKASSVSATKPSAKKSAATAKRKTSEDKARPSSAPLEEKE
jgi:hypothetical protein